MRYKTIHFPVRNRHILLCNCGFKRFVIDHWTDFAQLVAHYIRRDWDCAVSLVCVSALSYHFALINLLK
jgi:hypothetical protein